jgi:hypothetical protein
MSATYATAAPCKIKRGEIRPLLKTQDHNILLAKRKETK